MDMLKVLLSSTFLWCCLLRCKKVVLTLSLSERTPMRDQSNESYRAVLSRGAVYYAAWVDSYFLIYG